MADDIRRYLNNEPIQARPPGYLYTLGKFLPPQCRRRWNSGAGIF